MAEDTELTFWEHLDILRAVIIKILVVGLLFGLVAFCFKDQLFDIVLAPKSSKFISYRLMGVEPFDIKLVNIGITEQFMIHMKTALGFGLLGASPYILYQLYQFIAPALYNRERHYAVKIVLSGYIMFLVGVLVNYFIIFPLTVRFLGTYQVSPDVANMLTISNYVDTLMSMNMLMGIVFELPVVCWLAGSMGLLSRDTMRRFRRHAIVAILIVAAIITPTTDMLTLIIVSMPIWMLYEISIMLVRDKRKE